MLIIHREQGVVYGRAWYFIRDTYAKELNDGKIPDWGTVYRLSELIKKYKASHENELRLPAKEFLVNALREAPFRIKEERAYWNKAKCAAEKYFDEPTPENARNLFLALPEDREKVSSFLDAEGEDILSDFVFDFSGSGRRKNFSILEKGIEAGESNAIDVAFRLFNISDGMTAESLCFIIGKLLVDKHPRLFLQKALIYEKEVPEQLFHHLDCMLFMVAEWGFIPEAGNDPKKYEQIHQERIQRRIQALESVDDPELKDIRDRCLSMLKKDRLIRTEPFLAVLSKPCPVGSL